MKSIKITDDKREMEQIGRQLFDEKRDIYNDRIINIIRSAIDSLMSGMNQAEKNQLFFTSIYDYWMYGVNINEDLYFHFYKKTHEEKSGYLTQKNRELYYRHLNDKNDVHSLRNKYEAYQKFKDYYRRDVILISCPEDFDIFRDFVQKHPFFVVKPTDLSCAVGVHRDEVRGTEQVRDTFERLLQEIGGVYDKAYWGKAHSFVIEEWIRQSNAFSSIYPNSVNAIRCTTVNVEGKVHIFYPWVKLGSGGADIASAAIGGIDAGVDAVTGIVDTVAYDENMQTYDRHPDSGIQFKGYQIPRWDELIDTVTRLAKLMPTVRYIGWDMVLTDDGWIVMEGNDGGEFLGQLMWCRGFKQEFEELINWKPSVLYWWE